MTAPNGEAYFLPAERAQGLANYPHARTVAPATSRLIFVSGTSSRRGDGTYEGCETLADGTTHRLDCGAQTAAVLRNIEAILRGATAGRCGLESVVDATVFLTDMADYAAMNAEWNKRWPDKAGAPARTCVQVAALPNVRLNVEIKCQALVSE